MNRLLHWNESSVILGLKQIITNTLNSKYQSMHKNFQYTNKWDFLQIFLAAWASGSRLAEDLSVTPGAWPERGEKTVRVSSVISDIVVD